MTVLLAIDPGNLDSAYVEYDIELGRPLTWAKLPNAEILDSLDHTQASEIAIEAISSYGMSVGAEIFATCIAVGRFFQRWIDRDMTRPEPQLVYRRDVKLHLCHDSRAKDSNVRQALIDKFGPGKELAVGRKASPGPLYGIKSDIWSALAVAVTATETEAP